MMKNQINSSCKDLSVDEVLIPNPCSECKHIVLDKSYKKIEGQIENARCSNENVRAPSVLKKNYVTGTIEKIESNNPFCSNARMDFTFLKQCGTKGRYFEKRDEEQNKAETKADEDAKISFWQKIKNLFKSVFSSGI